MMIKNEVFIFNFFSGPTRVKSNQLKNKRINPQEAEA